MAIFWQLSVCWKQFEEMKITCQDKMKKNLIELIKKNASF